MIKSTCDWFVAAGHQPENPKFDAKQAAFYTGMQLEELAEKLGHILGQTSSLVVQLHAVADDFKSGKYTLSQDSELLDADLDLIWVSIGAARALGVDVEKAYAEVAKSNWAKFPAVRHLVTGKIIKPAGWQPPNLKQFFPEN